MQIDSAIWLFVTPDRKQEDWSRVIVVQDGTADRDGKPVKRLSQEFGSSSKQIVRTFDKHQPLANKLDRQPAMRQSEQYALDVTTVSDTGAVDPLQQDLPPFYLPQALAQLLPRLL